MEDDTRASDDEPPVRGTRGVEPMAKVDALPALAHAWDFAAIAVDGGAMLSVAKAVNMFYRRAPRRRSGSSSIVDARRRMTYSLSGFVVATSFVCTNSDEIKSLDCKREKRAF